MDQALKNAAAGAIAACEYAHWENAANAYKAHHPELPNIFGIVQLPQEFPSYPIPCVRAARTPPPPKFRTSEASPPRPVHRDAGLNRLPDIARSPQDAANGTPGGFYVGGSFSAGRGAYDRSQSQLITLNIIDPTDPSSRTGTSSYVSGGLLAGINLLTFEQIAMAFGVEAAYDWADKNDAFLGNVPNTTLGPNTDRLSVTRNSLFSLGGTVTVPISGGASIIASGGWARSMEEITIDCNSSCVAAGTPTFRSVQSQDFDGWYWGIGAQGRVGMIGSRPLFLRGEFRQYHFEGRTFSAGAPAAAFISAHVEPRIDQFRASVVVPLFDMPTYVASDIRLKRDIVRVGELDNGLGLYRYKYNGGEREYVGVMAQEAAQVVPDAVHQADDGYLRVDYGKLGIRLQTWDEYEWSHTAATPQAAWRRTAAMQGWPAQRDCAAPRQDFSVIIAALPGTLPVAR